MNCYLINILCVILIIFIIIALITLKDTKKLVWSCYYDNKTGIKLCE